MPHNELRIFISSTFRDLQEEREHLVRKIFPEIRALCRERGVTFTDVDLRWGLTEEQAALGTVIRTCLEEVDKCRPYFIGMIGNRYGWVPELHDVLMDPDLLAKYPFVEEMAIDGRSVTEMEFIHGVFDAPNVDGEYAFFYHRSGETTDADDPERLDSLIERVRSTEYPYREFTDVEALGEAVRSDLVAMIEKNWPAEETPTELDHERRAHAAFAASRTRAYIPNPHYLKEFATWIDERETPLVITGDSGLGKSSLVAYLTDTYHRKNPDAFIIAHYVGASKASGTALSVMRHIVEAIRVRFDIEEELPSTEQDLQKSFANWLFRCEHLAGQEEIDVLIVIDAVNQLDEAGRRMTWLPETIPPGMKLLISTTPGDAAERLSERAWSELCVEPLEDERIRQSIIVRYLGEFRKGVNPAQLRRVIEDEKARSPLYLRVVAEELRLHGEHETLDEEIDRLTGAADLLEVFEIVLERIERDHGEQVVRDLLSLVASSRSGLSEDELLELLAISRLDLSRLLFSFDYHLLRRDGLLDFFHDYLRRAVEKRYLSDEGQKRKASSRLVAYFEEGEITLRRTLELLHGLESIGDRERLQVTLTQIDRFVVLWRSEEDEVMRLLSPFETSEVVTAFGSALDRWSRQDRTIEECHEASRDIAAIYRCIGAWKEEEDLQRDCLGLARESEDRKMEAISLGDLGLTALKSGRLKEAEEFFLESEELARDLGDRRLLASTLLRRGHVRRNVGELSESLTIVREGESILRELGDHRLIDIAVNDRGLVHFDREEYSEALSCFREGEAYGREVGSDLQVARSVGNRGAVHEARGEYVEALACYHEKKKIARELGEPQTTAIALSSLGGLHLKRGEHADALVCIREAEQIARELGDRPGIAFALLQQGNAHRACEEYPEALACLHAAADEYRDFGMRIMLCYVLDSITDVLLSIVEHSLRETVEADMPAYLSEYIQSSDPDRWQAETLQAACSNADECMSISLELSSQEWEFWSRVHLARIDAAEGDAELAIEQLEVMLARFDEPTSPAEEATRSVDKADVGPNEDIQKAELHYQLWRLGASDHHAPALALYERVYESMPDQQYMVRIEELKEG